MQNNKELLGTTPIGKLLFKLALPTVVVQLINMIPNKGSCNQFLNE